jgi:hypothetical protein
VVEEVGSAERGTLARERKGVKVEGSARAPMIRVPVVCFW